MVPRGVVTAFAARMLASAFWTIADHFGSTTVARCGGGRHLLPPHGRPPKGAAFSAPVG